MSRSRIAPSEQLTKAIEELLSRAGEEEGPELLRELARVGAERLIQQALEQEQADHLGRGRYERQQGEQERRYRNGYEPGRLLIGDGAIAVQRPQVRGGSEPYRSRIWDVLASGRSAGVERLVVEMYARGLSTRDIEDLFRSPEGEVLLSKSAVSELTDALWEEYEAFSQRDLSDLPVGYLIVDGVYEAMRRYGTTRDGLLVAWGILEDGRRLLIHLELGNRESYESCLGFLRGLIARGLPVPVLVTSDGAPGMIRAIEEAFPTALRQRCLFHKKQNVLAKVPESEHAEVLAFLNAVYLAPSVEMGETLAKEFVTKYERTLPSAVRCFLDDLTACLAQLRCPEVHRKAIRTTNIIERSFEELKRRTKVIPRFFDERSCIKLAYAELIRAGQRSKRVRMSAIELKQLTMLRRALEEAQPHSVRATPRANRKTA